MPILTSRTLSACLVAFAGTALTAGAQTHFGSVDIGRAESATVTVRIDRATKLSSIEVVTQGSPNLDFTKAGGGTCATGIDYAANAKCTVKVRFEPRLAGARYGAVVLVGESGVVGTTYLQGIGVGPQVSFMPGAEITVAPDVAWSGGIAVDGHGDIYFSSSNQPFQLYKETLSAGSYTQSVVPTSELGDPSGVAVDGAGNVYIADCDHFRVLKETLSAGGYSESTVASFAVNDGSAPVGVAVDGGGNVYVALGSEAGTVYKETLTATGYTQSIVVSGLPADDGIAVDRNGNVYVAVNETNGWIVKATPAGDKYAESTIPVSGEGIPVAVAVDGSGNLYVSFIDSNDNGQVFKETPTVDGYIQSTIKTSTLNQPMAVAVDGSGDVYIGNSGYYSILKEDLSKPPSLSFATTRLGKESSDSPRTVVISNIGNAELKFSGLSYPADFPEASWLASNCTAWTKLASGGTCRLTIAFKPEESLDGRTSKKLSEHVTLTTDTLNAAGTRQAISVSGTETEGAKAAAKPVF
jgi:sugar lactone lactonase YvrE